MKAAEISLGRDFARGLDPILLAKDCGIDPDPVQAGLLTTTSRRVLVNCCRQWGKSTTTSLIALHEALYQAPAMVILGAPAQTQSVELFRKIHDSWKRLPGAPEANQESLTRMELGNGSRIIALSGSERTARGYSGVTTAIIDEAARVDEALLAAIMPMLATRNGRLFALSTPAGKRGFFHDAWTQGKGWERVRVKGDDCPRISAEFLAEQLQTLGPMLFAQEYCCEFIDPETSAFSSDLIAKALTNDFEPFFTNNRGPHVAASHAS